MKTPQIKNLIGRIAAPAVRTLIRTVPDPPLQNDNVKLSQFLCNRSKMSASLSSGVPNTEKRMKARRRRRNAFIVSRCLEPLMKNEARVFELASQASVTILVELFPNDR